MIRTTLTLTCSFGASKPFTVRNFFTNNPIKEYTSLDSSALSSLLQTTANHRQIWASLPSQKKEQNILSFIEKLENDQVISQCCRLLSGSTGKELSECQAELQIATQVFKHQSNTQCQRSNPFGTTGFQLEPFDFLTSIFDHRQPFLSSLNYLALALRSNNALLLRPTPQVIPATECITSLWNSCSQVPLFQCLLDSECDPKHDDCCIGDLLNSTEGFLSFRGRLREGLDFHYFMSQRGTFRESEFLLTSSDAAYIMRDLSPEQLKEAARVVARGCFSNCGQNFNSLKRVFVDREVSSHFEALLLQQAKQYQIHSSLSKPDPDLGLNEGKLAPFFLESQFQESQAMLEELKGKHHQDIRLLQGGEASRIAVGGRELGFIQPAVFRVETDFPACNYQNLECMMPICFLAPVDSTNDCIEKINSSIFGTTASLFTNQLELAETLAPKLEVGTVNLNSWEVAAGVTYSGRKRSGKGFSLGALSYNNIVRSKSFSFT